MVGRKLVSQEASQEQENKGGMQEYEIRVMQECITHNMHVFSCPKCFVKIIAPLQEMDTTMIPMSPHWSSRARSLQKSEPISGEKAHQTFIMVNF